MKKKRKSVREMIYPTTIERRKRRSTRKKETLKAPRSHELMIGTSLLDPSVQGEAPSGVLLTLSLHPVRFRTHSMTFLWRTLLYALKQMIRCILTNTIVWDHRLSFGINLVGGVFVGSKIIGRTAKEMFLLLIQMGPLCSFSSLQSYYLNSIMSGAILGIGLFFSLFLTLTTRDSPHRRSVTQRRLNDLAACFPCILPNSPSVSRPCLSSMRFSGRSPTRTNVFCSGKGQMSLCLPRSYAIVPCR